MDIAFLSSTMVTLLKALPMTLALFAVSVTAGCLLALLIVWMRVGGNRYLAAFAKGYIFVFRDDIVLFMGIIL